MFVSEQVNLFVTDKLGLTTYDTYQYSELA